MRLSHFPSFPQQLEHVAVHGECSCAPHTVRPFPPLSGSALVSCAQTFHLVHPMGSSSTPTVSLSHALDWRIIIRPLKEIANQLAYFWSCIRLRNPLRLSLWALLPRGRGCHRHYRSLTEEQRWWDESARIRRAFFARSDARRASGEAKGSSDRPECPSSIPLIMSYVPRLLPQYRDHIRPDDAANDYELMPSTYRKWHRLVFPHEVRSATPGGARGEKSHNDFFVLAESTLLARGSQDGQIHQHTRSQRDRANRASRLGRDGSGKGLLTVAHILEPLGKLAPTKGTRFNNRFRVIIDHRCHFLCIVTYLCMCIIFIFIECVLQCNRVWCIFSKSRPPPTNK